MRYRSRDKINLISGKQTGTSEQTGRWPGHLSARQNWPMEI